MGPIFKRENSGAAPRRVKFSKSERKREGWGNSAGVGHGRFRQVEPQQPAKFDGAQAYATAPFLHVAGECDLPVVARGVGVFTGVVWTVACATE